MQSLQFLFPAIIVLSAVAGVSCAPPPPPPRAEYVMYQWYEDKGKGDLSVDINLRQQIARVKRSGEEIGWAYVATGVEGKGTPAGSYRVMEKVVDKYSTKYGWIENEYGELVNGDARPWTEKKPGEVYKPSKMPYWMRLTSYGIGMHVGKIPKPGMPASHGCIRMPEEFVSVLFDKAKVGTPVQIRY